MQRLSPLVDVAQAPDPPLATVFYFIIRKQYLLI